MGKKFNFEFGAKLVKTRTRSGTAIFSGLVAGSLLAFTVYKYFNGGFQPLDFLVDLFGLNAYSDIFYLVWIGILFFLSLPAFFTVLKKKVIEGGKIYFDEKILYLTDGKNKYEIPQEDLDELVFELKELPAEHKTSNGKLIGGNYMIIPMSEGEYKYELQIDSDQQKEQLLNMVEFLKIEHDVKVKVINTKTK